MSYKNTFHNSFFDICQNLIKTLYKDNKNLKSQLNFNFLTDDVKGLQSTKKQSKLFNFLKNEIGPKGILFLQESPLLKKHSLSEIKLNKTFNPCDN